MDGQGTEPNCDAVEPGDTRVVTADFLNNTISVLDFDVLVGNCGSREAALLDVVNVEDGTPPPFQLEVTPDGKFAVVTASANWLSFSTVLAPDEEIPPQPPGGVVLVVDLEKGEIVAEIDTQDNAMSVAILPDGTRAFISNRTDDTGGSLLSTPGGSMSIIDLEDYTIIDEFDVGPGPEQITLSPDGSLGMINTASDGSIQVFKTDDPRGTMTEPLAVGLDSSDMAWIPGTDRVVVANSISTPVHSFVVVDVSDPAAPEIVEEGPDIGELGLLGSIPYVVTPIPGTQSMVMTAGDSSEDGDALGGTFAETRITRVDFSVMPAVVEWSVTRPNGRASIALGIAVDPTGTIGLAGMMGDNVMMKIDLGDGTLTPMPWLGARVVAPSYVDIH